jgi:hypothetical protein
MLSAMLVEWQLKLRDRHRVAFFGDKAQPPLLSGPAKLDSAFTVLS